MRRLAAFFLLTSLALPVAAEEAPASEDGPAAPEPSPPSDVGDAREDDAEDSEPTLARPPELKQLVQAEIPRGTDFPEPEVVVVLELEVNEQGAVSAARIAESAGEPFDAAALEAAQRFEFTPAVLTDGQPVPVVVTFRMTIQAPPPPVVPPADPVRYVGTLLERGTRTPLVGVEVAAQDGETLVGTAVTDEEGRFTLDVAAPTFRLRGVAVAHEPLDIEVRARPGELREETIYLEATGGAFETVVRAQRVRREVTRQVLPRAIVERVAGTAGDTLKVVENLPGAARQATRGPGAGDVILRGANPGDSRVFLEGQEIPILYHFGNLRSSFNSYFLDSVEFYPGNFAPDYGRAIGGIINVKVRDPADDAFRGVVDVNVYDAGFALEGPVSESWSLGGAFHRSWIDAILPAVLPDDVPLSFETAPAYYDYQVLATYRPNANHRLRLMFFGSLDRAVAIFDRPAGNPKVRGELAARLMYHALQASYRTRLSEDLVQETSLQVRYQEFKAEIGPELYFNLYSTQVSLRSAWEYSAAEWLSLRGGLDLTIDPVTIDLQIGGFRPVEGENSPPSATEQVNAVARDVLLVRPAVFLEATIEASERLTLLPSLRVDYYRSVDALTADPRLMLRFRLLEDTVLKGGIGLYQQPPREDQVVPDVGNPDLLPLRSLQASLGIEQSLFDGVLTLEVTGFRKWLDRLVTRNPRAFADPSEPVYLNEGTGNIYGVELLLKARVADRFVGWIAYTYQRSFRRDGLLADQRRFDYDQPHILTILGTYDIGWGFSFGARFRYVSGNPDTPVVGSVYDAASDSWVPVYGETNSDRLDAFHQLDLRVDKTFTFDWWKLSVYLDVQNVYNRANPEGMSYQFDYRDSGVSSGLPIIPILGIKGEW